MKFKDTRFRQRNDNVQKESSIYLIFFKIIHRRMFLHIYLNFEPKHITVYDKI